METRVKNREIELDVEFQGQQIFFFFALYYLLLFITKVKLFQGTIDRKIVLLHKLSFLII